ncbi:YciI family protein [Algicella marina]|uniref:YCII-related domain-containing protein n=1 Tax=Algicella marina TaxID=2683284 RepID=A0A6P1T306_9RHOB|nr:YciI family protein [Algicella marina]QHQ35846.1 hypothetical protein GO499_12015 [Algicella marina]
MQYAVIFEDAEGKGELRASHMAAHLKFLESSGAVLSAGPLVGEDGCIRSGLWLVEAPGREAVEALVREDPFWPTGLRAGYEILEWRRVFERN